MRALRYAGLLLVAVILAASFSVFVSETRAPMALHEARVPAASHPGVSLPGAGVPGVAAGDGPSAHGVAPDVPAGAPAAPVTTPPPGPAAPPPGAGIAPPFDMGLISQLRPGDPPVHGFVRPSSEDRPLQLDGPGRGAAAPPPPAAVLPVPPPPPSAGMGVAPSASFGARRAIVEKAAREQAETARVIARVPQRMSVGTDEKAELFIQHGEGAEAAALGGPGAAIDVAVPVTVEATARAEARTSNIEVTPVPGIPDTQAVSSIAPTRWAWNVTAKRAGEAEILFTLTHKVAVDGRDLNVPVKYFPQKVNITIEPWVQVKAWLGDATNLVTLLTSFLVAAGGLIAIFRPRKPA